MPWGKKAPPSVRPERSREPDSTSFASRTPINSAASWDCSIPKSRARWPGSPVPGTAAGRDAGPAAIRRARNAHPSATTLLGASFPRAVPRPDRGIGSVDRGHGRRSAEEERKAAARARGHPAAGAEGRAQAHKKVSGSAIPCLPRQGPPGSLRPLRGIRRGLPHGGREAQIRRPHCGVPG